MLAIQFGAGNIGRGFLGQVLSEAGYEICFMDVNEKLIQQINQEGSYTIHFLDKGRDDIHVQHISAVNSQDMDKAVEKIVSADLITTAVGVKILPYIAPLLAEGIRRRLQRQCPPVNIIACENAIHASTILQKEIWPHLTADEQQQAEKVIGFPNAAVDRIVTKNDDACTLDVTVESFYEWDVDQNGIKGVKPPVPGIHYTDRLEAYIERKLFVVNAMHAAMAYLGSLAGLHSTAEVAKNQEIMAVVRQAGQDSGRLLEKKYHIPCSQTAAFQEKILQRFANPAITDPLLRVGRAPIRKLSPKDRLVSPYMQLADFGIKSPAFARVIAAAMCFVSSADEEAVALQAFLSSHTAEETLTHFTGIAAESEPGQMILAAYKQIKA